MKNKIEIFSLSLTVLGIYIYSAVVLLQFGFNSYFSIPSNFINFSIPTNIVLTYAFAQSFVEIYKWHWIILSIILLCAIFAYLLAKRMFLIPFSIVMILSLYLSVNVGMQIAKDKTSYFILSPECVSQLSLGQNSRYIIPAFYDDESIVIPIDQNNKQAGGFYIEKTTNLNCQINMDWNFGKIKQ